jgi:molecular chaperone GrpE (heat shock protein)
MRERTMLKISKWPFLLGDLLFLGLAAAIITLSQYPIGLWQALACFVCVGCGAWLGAMPFLQEYQAGLRLAETGVLAGSLSQIKNLEHLAGQISSATNQWQTVQEQAIQTSNTAKEVAERIAHEAKAFTEFLQKANDNEKANLRLEVEKLRRAEGEWLQMVIRLLDHIYALTQAAARSGQPGLIEQLAHFQNACRDVARRAGLVPFVVVPNEVFDEKVHQLLDRDGETSPVGKVAETIATGYMYQGQLLRRALVALQIDGATTARSSAGRGTEDVAEQSSPDETAAESAS